MKKLETNLTEARFIERMETLCVPYDEHIDVLKYKRGIFAKRNGNRFFIGLRLKMPHGYGYYIERLYGTYSVNERETVDVQYHFRKPFLYMLPFFVCLAFGIPILIATFYNGVTEGFWQWDEILATVFITVFGIGGLLMRSSSGRHILKNRLLKICHCKES